MYTRLKGFSLLEVLIAAAMLSALLASALMLQLKQMRAQQYAYQHSIASTQLFSLLERLKVAPIDQRSQVLSVWREQNTLLLPDTKDEYHCSKRCWAKLLWGTRQRYSLTMGKL